jgi:hypothetical protein
MQIPIKAFFFTNSFKEREKKYILRKNVFIGSQWGFVIRISKKTSLTSLDVNSFSFDRRRE